MAEGDVIRVGSGGHQEIARVQAADIDGLPADAVASVNGYTGVVVLTASDVSADDAGAADAAIAAAATDATTKANAAQAASQPLDSDLTAIAALSTTSYGRAFLALADAAALRTSAGLGTLATQSGTFSGTSSGTNTGDQTIPTGGTPAVVLGTANTAGTSPNFLRRDDTILAFDATTPAAVGTAAVGAATTTARRDHVHATGAGTPTTQAFGDAAATGSGPAAAMTDHKHAMPAAQTLASLGAAPLTAMDIFLSARFR